MRPDALHHHFHRDKVVPALGDDDVRVALARLNKLLVHRLYRAQILVHDAVKAASRKDKTVYDTVAEHGALLSKELKRLCNYVKGGNVGFDTVITRLQMQTYLTVGDFVYMQDKHGKPYGWGIAKYTTPEELFGYDFVTSAYGSEPVESKARKIGRAHV